MSNRIWLNDGRMAMLENFMKAIDAKTPGEAIEYAITQLCRPDADFWLNFHFTELQKRYRKPHDQEFIGLLNAMCQTFIRLAGHQKPIIMAEAAKLINKTNQVGTMTHEEITKEAILTNTKHLREYSSIELAGFIEDMLMTCKTEGDIPTFQNVFKNRTVAPNMTLDDFEDLIMMLSDDNFIEEYAQDGETCYRMTNRLRDYREGNIDSLGRKTKKAINK